MVHSIWIAVLKFEAYNGYWSLVRVADSDDKLNLVGVNCTYTGDSFEGTSFVCWSNRDHVDFTEIMCRFHSERLNRDRVSILPRSCVNFARCSLKFGSDLRNLHRGEEL